MNRYLCSFKTERTPDRTYDVIIIGSGIAGLYTALNIAADRRVLLLTKDSITENNSNLAQGGIAAAMAEDDFQLHIMDTLEAGCYYNLPEAVKIVVEESRENIFRLIELGVNFDRAADGTLVMTREGGHSRSRILHAKDATGREVIRALSEAALKQTNIEILEYAQAVDLLTVEDQCCGVVLWHQGEPKAYWAGDTVLATGGIGQLYRHTTNSVIASGDGIAMAWRAGARISDMEFIQFHPTALYCPNYDRNFLISEAVRGEGGILRNETGEAFMEGLHPLKDLAPRDVVARAILRQMELSGKPYVYLDVTHLDGDYLKERFPNIYERCLLEGIDITRDFIPICPVEHYLMGGVVTGLNGEASLPGLYACGEVAKTGTHGANRLASNSLLEALVFGRRIAGAITREPHRLPEKTLETDAPAESRGDGDLQAVVEEIQTIMTDKVFIFRTHQELLAAKEDLHAVEERLAQGLHTGPEYFKIHNMLNVANLIVEAALNRERSLGSHVIDAQGRTQ